MLRRALTPNPMLFEVLSAARDIGRLHEISSVLIRQGLGDVVRRAGLAGLLERAGKALHWKAVQGVNKETEVRLREALEELGPTFVKVGQILAGRSDLLPPGWTAELAKLQESAAPVDMEELRAQLREDLGAEPEEVFRDFDPEPLASASIAQVHRAALANGRPIVLKVRRPGIDEVVESDLRLLGRIADALEENVPELRRYRPRNLVRQIARSLRDELDLRVEARTTERMRRNLSDRTDVVIPTIHGDYTRERLCVMDYVPGPSVGDWLKDRSLAEIEPRRLADVGADVVLETVFVHGSYHADPHPGNLVITPDGRLGLLDFGMAGTLSESRRIEFLGLLAAIVERDVDAAVETLLAWSDHEAKREVLTQDCVAFVDRYHDLALKDLDTTRLLEDLTELLRENDLFLPSDVALLLKVFVQLDGLGRRLDPGFVMAARVEPFARRAMMAERSPGTLIRRGLGELRSLVRTLPRDVRDVARRARQGKFLVQVDMERLERFGQRIEQSSNRVTVGLVTAALIVGTSIALTVRGGPEVLGLPVFGLLGFTSSMAAGVWLLWSIFRSGRR